MSFKKNIDRRNFIKIGTVGVVSSLILNKFSPIFAEVESSGRNVSLTSKNFRKGIPTICNLCPAQCGILGFIQNNYLAGIQGNPAHPNNNGKICARGIAGMNVVYNPERILYPLMRNGKRGSGKWKKISWDTALTEIAKNIKQDSNKEFVFLSNELNRNDHIFNLLSNFSNSKIIFNDYNKDLNKAHAQKITWGEDIEINDVENAHYILNFGANPFESNPYFINFSQRIVNARVNNGAKLITIDPRLSNTATKSDKWIPIKPGTDAIVILAMANVIMHQNLFDDAFINQWTNISINELKSHLSKFTLEDAEKYSSIPKDTIKKLAIDFASIRPSLAFSGSGLTKHINGTENERCLMLLNAIVGNIDTKGGVCLPRRYNFNLDNIENNADDYLLNANKSINTFISYNTNPAYESPETSNIENLFKDEKYLPFSVAITTMMTETAALSDIILPTTTYLENWTLNSNPAFDLIPFIALGQPVIATQGESRSIENIIQDLLVVSGYKNNQFDSEQSIKQMISSFALDKNFNKFKTDGIWQNKKDVVQYKKYETEGFKTNSRKFEIKQRNLSELPTFNSIAEHITLKKNEFILIPYTVNVMSEQLAQSKWLSEIKHNNECHIHHKTGRKLRLHNGSKVILKSDVGEIEMKVKLSSSVHPDIIAVSKGFGHWEYGKIAQAEKFNSQDPDTKLIWWHEKGNGVNPNFIITRKSDIAGKGLAWNDTKITIT